MLSLTLASVLSATVIAAQDLPTQPNQKPTVLIGTVVKASANQGKILRTTTKGAASPINVMLVYDDGGREVIKALRPGNLVRIEAHKTTGPASKKVSAYYRPTKADTIRLTWNAALREKGVAGGTIQNFNVDGVLRNSGMVAMKGKLNVRLYQISSPNDWIKQLDFDIGAKRTAKFTTTFTIYNFEYIGATSVPRIEISGVSDLEISGVDD
jgi:hypothetical protein